MVTQKVRKPRGPRGRGLRSTSGCLTCRGRRLKCDEKKPICSNCLKSSRNCVYSETTLDVEESANGAASTIEDTYHVPSRSDSTLDHPTCEGEQLHNSGDLPHESLNVNGVHPVDFQGSLQEDTVDFGQSPSTTASFAPGTASYKWYELIARDAWRNPDSYQFLTSHGSRWSFNSQEVPPILLPHSPSSHTHEVSLVRSPTLLHVRAGDNHLGLRQPWNVSEPITLGTREAVYLQHYVDVVGPLLDLFDSNLYFTTEVLRLAFCNEGLLKSILALSASHRASCADSNQRDVPITNLPTGDQSSTTESDRDMALQYYYETLGYLSQSMRIPGYADSQEILANSVMISWYEAFESDSSPNWERHLKGVFWIQRSRNSDGESLGLSGAVWWTWLRQDVWAAFRNARKTLTIWAPTKALGELNARELACRVLYLQAKAVSFAAIEAHETTSFEQRMSEGEELLIALEDWYRILPAQFAPLPVSVVGHSSLFCKPLWIHPPVYAAAMQTYNSAKILVLLNRPSRGGRQEFHARQKMLNDCIESICGIAGAPNARHPPLAMVNAQALFIGKPQHTLTDFANRLQLVNLCSVPSINKISYSYYVHH